MKRFRNFPIQQKMLVMTLLICGAVLLVAIAALFVFQVLNFRSNFERDAATLAVVIADNSAAACFFGDDVAATGVLDSLTNKPTVVTAFLVLTNGSFLAYSGKAEFTNTLSQFPPAGGSRFTRGHLLVTQPVVWKGERVGTLYLRTDYQRTFMELLRFYGLVIVGILIVSISLAVFLSSRLGRTITQPVLELARTAQTTMETAATDNGGSYALMTEPAKLQELEKTIPIAEAGGNAYLSEALGSATGYKVVAKASASSGDKFTIENAEGVITRSCTTAGKGGCPAGGKW